MFTLYFSEQFDKSFYKLEKNVQKQVWKKILELEKRAPLGKKLKDNPYWSIHVNRYRIIYGLKGTKITLADIFERKHKYRELK